MTVNPATATRAGYQNAITANNTVAEDYPCSHAEALVNLASATESGRDTVHVLVTANASLTTQLATVATTLATTT